MKISRSKTPSQIPVWGLFCALSGLKQAQFVRFPRSESRRSRDCRSLIPSEVAIRRNRDVFVRIIIFPFSANYSFLLSFPRPPGGTSKQKKSFTLSARTNPCWRREWDSNPRGRDAQRLSCQPTNIQMGSRGRRFNHSAIPAQQPTKTETSLKPFQTIPELLDQ